MNRKKIYIAILVAVSVIISVTYFSYAFFFKTDEIHGYLNYVVGTLNYKIESESLTNNQITVPAGTVSELVINLTSLNSIETDYKLYYETDNSEIEVGYTEDTTDMPNGTIGVNEVKTIKILIKNKTALSATITFSVKGGFVDKEFTVNGTSITEQLSVCDYAVGYYWDFAYTGNVQTFKTPCDGTYQLEVWGAQGGSINGFIGGQGGYSKGDYSTTENTNLYVVVGGAGVNQSSGGYNGGGNGNGYGAGGGGMTDIRTTTNLANQIIVAGGGGGANNRGGGYGDGNGGAGGGLNGENGAAVNHTNGYGYGYGQGGSQTAGGLFYWSGGGGTNAGYYSYLTSLTVGGTRGQGGAGVSGQSGGGGGYYGGAGGGHGGAGGGSGYIGGVNNGTTQVGGRTGNGCARITYKGI